MREIKFRAWNGRSMLEVYGAWFEEQGNWDEVNLEKCANNYEENILMQYTGLKDKNGKKIYEGDILKCNLWKNELNGTAIVKYDAPRFYLDYSHNEDNFPEDFAEQFWKFEIIGNVHENQERILK